MNFNEEDGTIEYIGSDTSQLIGQSFSIEVTTETTDTLEFAETVYTQTITISEGRTKYETDLLLDRQNVYVNTLWTYEMPTYASTPYTVTQERVHQSPDFIDAV